MFPLDQLDAKTELVEELAAYTCYLNEAYLKAAGRKAELSEFTKFLEEKLAEKLNTFRKSVAVQADAQKYFEKWLLEFASKHFAPEVAKGLFEADLATGIDNVHKLIALTEKRG